MSTKALSAIDVRKSFRKNKKVVEALKGVSIQIRSGEIYGLLGPNGSGKSTFIRIASTLLFPDAGSVEVFGFDVAKQPREVQRLINRVSVEASFFRKLTAMENLLFSAGLHGMSKKETLNRILDIAPRIGLDSKRLRDPIEDFSRGMQQKVAIARAFICEPRMLLLDEPTTGLDPRAKREVQSMISQMRRDSGTTILLTTHDMEEAERLCDYVGIIHDGEIVVSGKPADLKTSIASRKASVTFEDVFLAYTGVSFEEANYEEVVTA